LSKEIAQKLLNLYGSKLIDKSDFDNSKVDKLLKVLKDFGAKLESSDDYKSGINERLNSILENRTSTNKTMHFMNFLTESKKGEFKHLPKEKQNLIVESMNKEHVMSNGQAENVWESCFIERKRELDFITDMPEKFISKWDSLSEGRKHQIIAESKFYPLNNQYAINNFWSTRDLRDNTVNLQSINEAKTAAEQTETKKEPMINEAFAKDLVNRVKFNLGR